MFKTLKNFPEIHFVAHKRYRQNNEGSNGPIKQIDRRANLYECTDGRSYTNGQTDKLIHTNRQTNEIIKMDRRMN